MDGRRMTTQEKQLSCPRNQSPCPSDWSPVGKASTSKEFMDTSSRIKLLSSAILRGELKYPDAGMTPLDYHVRGTALANAVQRNAGDTELRKLGGFTSSRLSHSSGHRHGYGITHGTGNAGGICRG